MNVSKLLYPPIKCNTPKKLPECLFMHQYTDYAGVQVDKFTLIPTDKKHFGKRIIMKCFPEYIDRDGKINIPSLYVWKLTSNCSGDGFGTKMLNFAQNYSRRLGCNGYLHLSADVCYTPNRVPHLFYRKYGMSTDSTYIDKKLDRFIKKGKDATYREFNTMNMFYPPIEHPKNKIEKLVDKFTKTLFRQDK